MKETAIQVNERRIRNGIRKQAEKIQREKDKVWDKLKDTNPPLRTLHANWTVDELDDINAMVAFDLEQERRDIVTAEINASKSK